LNTAAGKAAEPSLSLHPRVVWSGVVCALALLAGALAGDAVAAGLAVVAVAIPAAVEALSVRRLGRQRASVMAGVALVSPCVRLVTSVILAIGAWVAAARGIGGAAALDGLSFWGAFMIAALGTLAVETLGFAADFHALTKARTTADTETVSA